MKSMILGSETHPKYFFPPRTWADIYPSEKKTFLHMSPPDILDAYDCLSSTLQHTGTMFVGVCKRVLFVEGQNGWSCGALRPRAAILLLTVCHLWVDVEGICPTHWSPVGGGGGKNENDYLKKPCWNDVDIYFPTILFNIFWDLFCGIIVIFLFWLISLIDI